jgi:hypothetical protein
MTPITEQGGSSFDIDYRGQRLSLRARRMILARNALTLLSLLLCPLFLVVWIRGFLHFDGVGVFGNDWDGEHSRGYAFDVFQFRGACGISLTRYIAAGAMVDADTGLPSERGPCLRTWHEAGTDYLQSHMSAETVFAWGGFALGHQYHTFPGYSHPSFRKIDLVVPDWFLVLATLVLPRLCLKTRKLAMMTGL